MWMCAMENQWGLLRCYIITKRCSLMSHSKKNHPAFWMKMTNEYLDIFAWRMYVQNYWALNIKKGATFLVRVRFTNRMYKCEVSVSILCRIRDALYSQMFRFSEQFSKTIDLKHPKIHSVVVTSNFHAIY